MTIAQALDELRLYPYSRECFELQKECAELAILEHYQYVQENLALVQDRYDDVTFTESFFVEAESESENAESSEIKLRKKKTSIGSRLAWLGRKIVRVLSTVIRKVNELLARIGIKRQKVIAEMNQRGLHLSEAELRNIQKTLGEKARSLRVYGEQNGDTYNMVRPKQPARNQIKIQTDCTDKDLLNNVKDLLAFGIGDMIVANSDGIMIGIDTPFLITVLEVQSAINHGKAGDPTLGEKLKKEQARAQKDGILFKFNPKNQDSIVSDKLKAALKDLASNAYGAKLQAQQQGAQTDDEAKYYAQAVEVWKEISRAVSVSTTLDIAVANYRQETLRLLGITVNVDRDENGKKILKVDRKDDGGVTPERDQTEEGDEE